MNGGISMNNHESLTFAEVLNIIENAGDFEMDDIMQAIRRRYQKFYPDWEVLYIACPKNDSEERQKTLELILDHFRDNT